MLEKLIDSIFVGKLTNLKFFLTLAGKVTGWLFTWVSLKMTERGGAGSVKRSFASKYLKF